MVGGVAAGVANWIGTDPALVRIAWALLVPLTAGGALLAYIVAWVVVPEEPRRRAAANVEGEAGTDADAGASAAMPDEGYDTGRTALIVGGGLVLIGLWFLVREYLPDINWGLIWPLLLVAAGVVILVGASRRR
jgi:phage shock protein PspC (stress-responsive transcriptional regulator)